MVNKKVNNKKVDDISKLKGLLSTRKDSQQLKKEMREGWL